ncbi:MAG TPA: hypothetical protein DEP19_06300, partial [Anaerolineae bacterium]|nr:hypothetical protein [Anaerolineae bacterium]
GIDKTIKKKSAKPKGGKEAGNILEQIHQLAWTGQHVKAIDVATQELSMSRLQRDIEMSLLDLRAESYIAQGQLDLAMQDAKAMMKIAKGDTRSSNTRISKPDSRLLTQALNRLALVQMRTG